MPGARGRVIGFIYPHLLVVEHAYLQILYNSVRFAASWHSFHLSVLVNSPGLIEILKKFSYNL